MHLSLDVLIPVSTKLLFSYIYSAENIFNLNSHGFQLHAHFFLQQLSLVSWMTYSVVKDIVDLLKHLSVSFINLFPL